MKRIFSPSGAHRPCDCCAAAQIVFPNGRSPGSGFPDRLPGAPVADDQAHVPYSRGGGTGFSPASRFTAIPSGSTVS